MNKKPKTYIYFIIDRSGSMKNTEKSVISDYNEQVQQQKQYSKDQDLLVSLITFNGSIFEHVWNQDINSLVELTAKDYSPNGSTAMFDAIGYCINTIEDRDDPNVAFLFYIISDGQENASVKFSAKDLKNKINACKETGRWTFTYMGFSENYLKEIANSTGIEISNCAVWSNSNVEEADHGLLQKRNLSNKYFAARSAGVVENTCFYSDDVQVCADFTTVDKKVNSNVDLSCLDLDELKNKLKI